ncbi:hemagglutinin-related protein [Escherichia coli]|nr:hemagglutinin-related protein [Escherichia coli]GDS43335.1 hemagglutinin-related protein [Escherichia coli]
MTYGETEAMKAARKEHPGMSDAQLRETPEYREVMKGYGTGSTPQMVVQAITGVLGGLNAGNPGQVLAGGLNPAVAQLIKQATGDNREANLMAHAVWGALAAQLGGNNAASGAAGAFSGELAARYIIDNYYGGRTDNLSEQERQQISMLATIASGIAGGLVGNSTSAAGTGAQAGRNSVENNALSLVARGCAVAAPCRTKVAEQLLEIGAKAGMAGLAGAAVKDMADRMTSDELEHLITLQMMGNDEITTKYLSSLHDKYGSGAASNPNIGKDLTDAEKVELGGSGSGTGTPPPSENDPKQQNEKPVDKLNQKQESAIKKIDNTIKNALKDHDIIGTLKDMDGKPVPKENGGYWDHMQEMQNTLRGLRNHADTLKNVNNPEAQAAYGRATDAINKIESALKGYGI